MNTPDTHLEVCCCKLERAHLFVGLLFALLRDYELQEKQRTHKYNHVKSKPEDWKVAIEKTDKSWVVTCPFMSDPNISACGQWKLTIDPNGAVSAAFVKLIFVLGGYR